MINKILKETHFEEVQNANHTFTKHFHDTYAMGITRHGNFKSYHLNKSYSFYKHSTKIINPYELHSGKSNSWNYINFYPDIKVLSDIYEQIFFEKKIPLFEKHIIDDKKLYELFYRFFYATCHTKNSLQIETSMIEALSHLIQNYTTTSVSQLILGDKTTISHSIEYIHDHLDKNITLQELAQLSHISKYHFLRIFKKYIGLTPHQYIINQRINSYKQQLTSKNRNKIAYNFGFYDQSHLIRNFKKIYGYTPKQLNKSNFILYEK